MSYRITIENYNNLNPDEQSHTSNNGIGKIYANYLRIKYKDKTIALYSDAIEPEDTSFHRDLQWIKTELEKAYLLGKQTT